jgi:hypothetical protein
VINYDPKLAARIGEREALFLYQLHYWHCVWSQKDAQKGVTEHVKPDQDGIERQWYRCTLESWLEQFPAWSKGKLESVIKSLKEQGLILTDRFNAHKYDRTVWYALHYQNFYKVKGHYSPDNAPEPVDPTPQGSELDFRSPGTGFPIPDPTIPDTAPDSAFNTDVPSSANALEGATRPETNDQRIVKTPMYKVEPTTSGSGNSEASVTPPAPPHRMQRRSRVLTDDERQQLGERFSATFSNDLDKRIDKALDYRPRNYRGTELGRVTRWLEEDAEQLVRQCQRPGGRAMNPHERRFAQEKRIPLREAEHR